MEIVVDQLLMQEIDRITTQNLGIPGMVLMERAALKVTEKILQMTTEKDRILVVVGTGNNGGDGLAVVRQLFMADRSYQRKTDYWMVGDRAKLRGEAKSQLTILQNLGAREVESPRLDAYTVIVDAIFGVGLSRPVTGRMEEVIRQINEVPAKKIAVDLPSGIDATTGAVQNVAVRCDVTITFGYLKLGLIRYPGKEYAGEVLVADVGFPELALQEAYAGQKERMEYFTYDTYDLKRFPARKQQSHKGTFGTVLIIAGSRNMSGACYFSAKACYRCGAGLVKILTVEENREILQTQLPEAVLETYGEDTFQVEHKIQRLKETFESADVIVIGPGIGTNPLSQKILEFTLKYGKVPIVIDADAINLLASRLDLKLGEPCNDADLIERMELLNTILPENVILTPHMKEFARLLGRTIAKILINFLDTLRICPYNKNLTYVIKDAQTTVASSGKRYFNRTGNDGLSTGGSGDVLTGIIAALIAQGMDVFQASCLGVYLHGRTADRYVKEKGSYSMIASDIIEQLPYVRDELS